MGVGMRIRGSAAGVHACMCSHVSSWSWRLIFFKKLQLLGKVTVMQNFSVDFCCFWMAQTYRMLTFEQMFSDGEIISQIKMTNIALAEIKELLKQQVKTHVRQMRLRLKGKKK